MKSFLLSLGPTQRVFVLSSQGQACHALVPSSFFPCPIFSAASSCACGKSCDLANASHVAVQMRLTTATPYEVTSFNEHKGMQVVQGIQEFRDLNLKCFSRIYPAGTRYTLREACFCIPPNPPTRQQNPPTPPKPTHPEGTPPQNIAKLDWRYQPATLLHL